MTVLRPIAVFCAMMSAVFVVPVLAQGAGGGFASVPKIQPASGGAQVRQPPQNSAIRAAGGLGAAGQVGGNPQGVGGMGAGITAAAGAGSSTNGMTLSAGPSGNAMRTGSQASGSQGQTGIDANGVTRRTPTGSGGSQN